MQAAKTQPWHRPHEPRRPFHSLDGETVRARTAEIESAFHAGLRAGAQCTIRPTEITEPIPCDPADRLAEHEPQPGEPAPVPLICRMPADCDDPVNALASLPDEIFDALDGAGREEELDPYPLASAFYGLGMHLAAVSLLERAIRLRGATVAACELMGKCLLGLGRPELAAEWFLRPLKAADLDAETVFELVRQASVCSMEMQSAA